MCIALPHVWRLEYIITAPKNTQYLIYTKNIHETYFVYIFKKKAVLALYLLLSWINFFDNFRQKYAFNQFLSRFYVF